MISISKPGVICSNGHNYKEFIESCVSSKRVLTKTDEFIKDFMVGKVDCELANFNKNTEDVFITRTNNLLLTSALQIENQILKAVEKYGANKIGVVVATTTAGIKENYKAFENGIFKKEHYITDRSCLLNPSIFIKNYFHLSSLSYGVSTACTSGIKAIIEGVRLITSGFCDAVICAGSDSLNHLTLNGFASLGVTSLNYNNPFSKNRDGINIGEGAATFLLCKDEISNVLVASYASNCDAYHITTPREDGKFQTQLIQETLKKVNLNSVDYINLHGTGTTANDKMESNAVYNSLKNVKCSSIKPLIGHTLGAAGIIENVLCFALCDGEKRLPPHLFDGQYDSELKKINLVEKKETMDVKSSLNLSFAFGGDNTALLLKRL